MWKDFSIQVELSSTFAKGTQNNIGTISIQVLYQILLLSLM